MEGHYFATVEGSMDGRVWRKYPTKYYTHDPDAVPPCFSPHFPRFDHMLFYAMHKVQRGYRGGTEGVKRAGKEGV